MLDRSFLLTIYGLLFHLRQIPAFSLFFFFFLIFVNVFFFFLICFILFCKGLLLILFSLFVCLLLINLRYWLFRTERCFFSVQEPYMLIAYGMCSEPREEELSASKTTAERAPK